MKLIIMTGASDLPIAINPNMIIGIRKCRDNETGCQTSIDTNNFTYKVKEDFATICAAIQNV